MRFDNVTPTRKPADRSYADDAAVFGLYVNKSSGSFRNSGGTIGGTVPKFTEQFAYLFRTLRVDLLGKS
ncbi:MAG: hypothetical protein LBQ66_01690 [Planctomycetaceae bacterium]|nr:hypothetical protein [Planctomycetaceae bacterium]